MNKILNSSKIIFSILIFLTILLRFIGLDKLPASLYWEEAALGYDAYSIAQTGRDHHNNSWPILAFESFGDWKPSLYFYIIVPFIKLFGLNSWAVRIPSAISGVLIVLGVYCLTLQLFQKKELALWAMYFATCSSWAIQFSRGGWEVNLATMLIVWGVVFLIKAINDERRQKLDINFLLGLFLLILSMYAYHAARMISPLLGLFLGVIWLKNNLNTIPKIVTTLISTFIIALISLSPFLVNLNNQELTSRFSQTNIFSDLTPILASNQCQEIADHTVISRILCHRYLYYGQMFATNYLKHFDLKFLFLTGDENLRHSTGMMGIFYLTDFILIIAGFIALFKTKHWQKYFLIFWLIIGILPSGLSFAAPHALRILPTLPVWMIVLSFGAQAIIAQISKLFIRKKQFFIEKISTIIIIIFTLAQLSLWLYHYINIYPQIAASQWQTGYQELFSNLKTIAAADNLPNDLPIYLTREQGRPAMYYFFYNQINPLSVQAQSSTSKMDQSEFLEYQDSEHALHFVNGLGELDKSNASLVAASPLSVAQFITDHPNANLTPYYESATWTIFYYQLTP